MNKPDPLLTGCLTRDEWQCVVTVLDQHADEHPKAIKARPIANRIRREVLKTGDGA
jgi:hypothetical protein